MASRRLGRQAGMPSPALAVLVSTANLVVLVRSQGVLLPTTTTTSSPRPQLSDHYICQTESCALHDEWMPVNFTNSSTVCEQTQAEMVDGFATTGPKQCRALKEFGENYEECRQDYCAMYEKALQKIAYKGGPTYYGGDGDQCRPFLNFNKTLCETDYRDAEAFCECLCPMMPLLEVTPSCEAEVFQFLLIGRRSPELQAKYPMTQLCARSMCDWFELIGDPNPVNKPDILGGVPDACHVFDIPFRRSQCERMVTNFDVDAGGVVPYQPCPWLDPGPGEQQDILECSDTSMHPINIREVDSWSVCVNLNFKWRCPENYPVMCAGRHCDGNADHCCQTDVSRCLEEEERQCSPLLLHELPEWLGILTPTAAVGRITTTTIDPLVEFLARTTTTVRAPNTAKEVEKMLPWIIAAVGALGACGSVVICLCLYKESFSHVAKAVWGGARLMKSYHTDPVEVYAPSQAPIDPHARGDLPPPKSIHEQIKDRDDDEATNALKDTVDAAYTRGFRCLVAYHGAPPMAEEEPLREALARVRQRGLQDVGPNAVLLDRGDKWLRIVVAERILHKATAEARPALSSINRPVELPGDGRPWISTLIGRQTEGNQKAAVWDKMELLAEALKTAKADGVQDALIRSGTVLLTDLRARTHELPADRCVLDPSGEGLKLLPRGKQRAMLAQTGDVYMYEPETMKAGATDDDLPPREELGNCDVDNARPVCAEYARTRNCKGGRRCPWRHAVPQPGDQIRECILPRDDDR